MSHCSENTLHLIGFGSQGRAWAQCLRASGWKVHIYLPRPESPSFEAARSLGFEPALLPALWSALRMDLRARPKTQNPTTALIALLVPDSAIGAIYNELLAPLDAELTLILAHGYAVYSGDLKPTHPKHSVALLAPKAIGPKIWSLYQEAQPKPHRLVAGTNAPADRQACITALASAMGFAPGNLIHASFEQEAIGDLLSEQGLLCGGVFTLMEWTMEAMKKAGVPAALIHEECLTELELIAGLLRERGPASTFKAISQAAQCGTVAMQESLNRSNARAHFDAQLEQVLSGRFVDEFRGNTWKSRAKALIERLERWENLLKKKDVTP